MKYLLLVSFLLTSFFSYSQKYNKAFLQTENEKLRKEIETLSKTLSKTKDESKTSLVYVINLNDKINKREQLVDNTAKEKRFIEDDIYTKQLQVNKYQRELADLRTTYGEVLVKAYKNKSVQNKILFILTSKDIGQAYRRVKYLKLYSDYQDDKADEIRAKIAAIDQLKASREKDIQEKQTVLVQQQVELNKLDLERKEKEKVVAVFKKNEGAILAKLNAKQKQSKQLEAQIEKAIQEEIAIAKKKQDEINKKQAEERAKIAKENAEKIRKAKEAAEKEAAIKVAAAKAEAEKKAKEEAKRLAAITSAKEREEATKKVAEEARLAKEKAEAEKKATVEKAVAAVKPTELPKSDYEKLSDNFVANKGSLPSPLPGGTTVTPFGESKHPITGTTINNPGIDISGRPNAKAKAVMGGEVSRISEAGGLKAIMVKHGEYFTIYSNIDDVYVKQGEKISAGQELGHIFVTDDNVSVLKFMVYKGAQKQNPSAWLK